jgi:hypothetical protein
MSPIAPRGMPLTGRQDRCRLLVREAHFAEQNAHQVKKKLAFF